jgi:hypothetical protein
VTRISASLDRRTLLASVSAAAGTAALSGCSFLERGEDAESEPLPADEARALAERFAPTLYFDAAERWFPTDPRPYVTEADGERVVDGFDALDGYVTAAKQGDTPPEPTAFYHGRRYANSPLAVVQFWFYSAFDQFTTNFHWHDWEVLHVFVDTDESEPQLYVASSHSGNVPNNEFLDPDFDREPRVLSELGSHSSALSLNDDADRFHRVSLEGGFADITNSAVSGVEALTNLPLAYGLPRDEGWRLPYLVPELDGVPLPDHERLPAVERRDLVPAALTVSSFSELLSPPADLPKRDTGLVFRHGSTGEAAEVAYDLVPTEDVEDIAAFTGPQLSFEFSVPQFAEDAIAGHITSTGTPWNQPRYTAPALDISDPTHREALASRYDAIGDPAPINSIVAGVTQAVTDEDAPEDEGVTTEASGVESVALVESEPAAVPTFQGRAVVQDVPEGDHRLTVNGAGVAPHSETVAVADSGGEPTVAGVGGEIPLVARTDATKLEVDAEGTDADLERLAVEDDFGGRLYDAPLSGPDAVYVHAGGAYTTEVADGDGELGAFRVNPGGEDAVRIEEPRTGAGSLAGYVGAVATETAASVSAVGDGDDGTAGDDSQPSGDSGPHGLARALEAVAASAERTAERAAAGDRQRADRSLETLETRLGNLATAIQQTGGELPADLERAVDRRFEQMDRRSSQAREAGKL